MQEDLDSCMRLLAQLREAQTIYPSLKTEEVAAKGTMIVMCAWPDKFETITESVGKVDTGM